MNKLMLFFIAYISGSIPFSFLLAKYCKGIDLRETGSKNVGATNLYRLCGFKYAFFGFFLDFFKGFLTLYLIERFLNVNELTLIFVAFFVILGHVFPIFLNFKGGKGVSTTAGVLFFLDYRIFLIVFVFFWLIFFIKRIVSFASIFAAILLIITSIIFFLLGITGIERVVFFVILGLLIIVFHRENIKRILNKEEKKINER